MPSTSSLRLPMPNTSSSSHLSARPTPPPAPCPWLWRCHQCHIWYRLSTTRRCLECSHEFCLGESQTTKKRKRATAAPCRAEFDYIGWAARGAWKRTVLLNNARNSSANRLNTSSLSSSSSSAVTKPTTTHRLSRKPLLAVPTTPETETGGILLSRPHLGQRWLTPTALATAWGDEHRALDTGSDARTERFAAKKEALFVRRRHNCWLHCDFPSECHHVVYKAQQEGRPVLGRARALDEAFLRSAASAGRRLSVDGEAEEELDLGASSGSDSDDSGDDMDVDELLPPAREHEVIEGVEASPISPSRPRTIVTPLDTEGGSDLSYDAFKRAAGIPDTSLTFTIHADADATDDDDTDVASPPGSPLLSSATAAPIAIPGQFSLSTPASAREDEDEGEDIDVFLSDAYTTAAQNRRRFGSTSPSDRAEGFTHFDAFIASSSPAASHAEPTTQPVSPVSHSSLRRLEQAYSEQPWFADSQTPPTPSNSPEPATITTITSTPSLPERSSSRVARTSQMLTLLSRRTSPTTTATASSAFDDWSSDSDASTGALTTASSPPSSADEESVVDADGDMCMVLVVDEEQEEEESGNTSAVSAVTSSSCSGSEDEITPTECSRGEGGEDAGLDALFRMRNAFMRGDL